MSRCNLLIN